jgi:hypothetical protein
MPDFTCSRCHGTWGKSRSDEEAAIEHEVMFGRRPDPDAGILCGDCWDEFLDWLGRLPPEQRLDIAEADQAAHA